MMKRTTLAVFATAAAAVVFSCKQEKTPEPVLVSSTVEVSLGGVPTKAFGDGSTEEWERTLSNISIYVYESTGSNKDVCVYQRLLTPHELKEKKAVFAIPNVIANTSYDFYAFANCDMPKENDGSLSVFSRPNLLKESEGVIISSGGTTGNSRYGTLMEYNDSDFSKIIGKAKRSYNDNIGFAMSGMMTATTPAAGSNVPTKVTIPLKRTVAKIAIQSAITDAFKKKYPDASFKITGVELKNLSQQTSLVQPESISSITLRTDPLKQNPNVVDDAKYPQYQNLFYIFENGVLLPTATAVPNTDKPVLVLKADFDFDGDPTTSIDISHITYNIKLAGEAVTTANPNPQPSDPNFGLFVRNGNYKINIDINGLTENEVVAEIKVLDWETLKTQNVEIGSQN